MLVNRETVTYIWVALWPAPFAACLVLSGRPNADQNNELVQPRLEWRTDDDDGSAASPLLPNGGGLRPGEERVPPHLEVAHIPYEQGGPYPGLFLFTQAARMARPVKQV